MEVLNSEITYALRFERNDALSISATEDALSLALRGLKIKNNNNNIVINNKKQIDLVVGKTLSKSLEEKTLLSLSGLPIYSIDEVSCHQSHSSCWIVLYDRVYDVTKFLDLHPGGHDILFENAGRDATFAFHGIHSSLAVHMLKEYLIGELPEKEKLYRKKTSHSISLADMPE